MAAVIRTLAPHEVERHLDDLAEVLADCVAGGAGVNFLLPFPPSVALTWWQAVTSGAWRARAITAG